MLGRGHQLFNGAAMGRGDGNGTERGAGEPLLGGDVDLARTMSIDAQGDAVIREGKSRNMNRAGAVRAYLERRQGPHTAPAFSRLFEKDAILLNREGVSFGELLERKPRLFARKNFRIGRPAKTFHGTNSACRFARQTDERAKIDQGGIETGGVAFGNEMRRVIPKFFAASAEIDFLGNIEEAGNQPARVRFDNGDGSIESESGDGVGGIAADTGKFTNGIDVAGKDSTMSILHDFGGGMEMARAIVIAEALPGVKDCVFGGMSEGGDIREQSEPFIIIGNDGRDLGLLEHDFGDEDGVWIAGAAPGEIAAVVAVPVEKRRVKRPNIKCRS